MIVTLVRLGMIGGVNSEVGVLYHYVLEAFSLRLFSRAHSPTRRSSKGMEDEIVFQSPLYNMEKF